MILVVAIPLMIPPNTMYDYQPKPIPLLHPPIRTIDIPLPSVDSIFDQSKSPVKIYSSCRFPPE